MIQWIHAYKIGAKIPTYRPMTKVKLPATFSKFLRLYRWSLWGLLILWRGGPSRRLCFLICTTALCWSIRWYPTMMGLCPRLPLTGNIWNVYCKLAWLPLASASSSVTMGRIPTWQGSLLHQDPGIESLVMMATIPFPLPVKWCFKTLPIHS